MGEVIPLFLDKDGSKPNIVPGLLEKLGGIKPEELAAYVYCLLANPEYTRRFSRDLTNCEVRIPLTKDRTLFYEAVEFGQNLLWLHTYGERYFNKNGRLKGKIPKGSAKCTVSVNESTGKYPSEFSYSESNKTITVGDGKFAPVTKEMWEFEVSGLKVVQSWLAYRMLNRKGKKTSPLDSITPRNWTYEFTREFLELLWVIEMTISEYPKQIGIFNRILASDLYTADDLPSVPEELRDGPIMPKVSRLQVNLLE